MFPHQLNGIRATKKSPHLPCPRTLVLIIGLNCIVLLCITLVIIKKYIAQKIENQNHHQYCHWDKCIKMSDLCVENPKLKLVIVLASVIMWPHTLIPKNQKKYTKIEELK